ncbi:MAG: hypothetical protein KF862_25565 [Chitinophagaceae bacterium]|nr:hypothetical protein [Chitinophagaceae bacterium]
MKQGFYVTATVASWCCTGGVKSLTQKIWKEDVLPAMGHRMGIYNRGDGPSIIVLENTTR